MSTAAPPLDTLHTLLKTALAMADALVAEQPLVRRLASALALLPTTHHESIVQIVEREARWFALSTEAGEVLGTTRSLRPNPGATLYVRSFESQPPSTLHSADVAQALVRLGTALHDQVVTDPKAQAAFLGALREALGLIPPTVRGFIGAMAEETVRAIATIDG
jgi:hypothetical protein